MLPATGGARLRSGGEPVLVQQPAETVNTLDDVPTFEPAKGQVGDWGFEVDAAVPVVLLGRWGVRGMKVRCSPWQEA